MPFARIIASDPTAARYTARTLHEAGYEVEIVPPGAPPDAAAELVFDLDADKMLSISTDGYVPSEREFVLKPMWRKFTAKRKADEDIARARRAYPRRNAARKPEAATQPTPMQPQFASEQDEASTPARRVPEAVEPDGQSIAAEGSRRAEEAERVRAQQLHIQREQEVARRREVEAQRAEQQARELELARRREREERDMIVRKQEEERRQAEAVSRQAEARARAEEAYQRKLDEQRAEAFRREALQRAADEAHRSDVMRQRQDEEVARRAEAQRLLLEANLRREESAREREAIIAPVPVLREPLPTLGQYMALRLQQRREARAAKSRSRVTPIDRGGRTAWRQAWPVTAGVAAACLIGWGIASYHDAAPAAASQEKPPILSPGQYAPYPVTAGASAPGSTARPPARPAKRSAVRNEGIAQDEVVVHHYYPSKSTTAQNQNPHKKITDLQ